MVGEIGGNDYNYALLGGKTMEEIKDIVPDVVQAITDAVRVRNFPKSYYISIFSKAYLNHSLLISSNIIVFCMCVCVCVDCLSMWSCSSGGSW